MKKAILKTALLTLVVTYIILTLLFILNITTGEPSKIIENGSNGIILIEGYSVGYFGPKFIVHPPNPSTGGWQTTYIFDGMYWPIFIFDFTVIPILVTTLVCLVTYLCKQIKHINITTKLVIGILILFIVVISIIIITNVSSNIMPEYEGVLLR